MAEEKKIDFSEIQKQIEYYLSDNNLKRDEFFHNEIAKSDTKSIAIDKFLNCNKIKSLGATAADIVKAVGSSDQVEVLADNTGVKRKNDTIPDLEPKQNKKVKNESTNGHDQAKDDDKFNEHIFIYTVTGNDEGNLKWSVIQAEAEKVFGAKIPYCRVNKAEGHMALNRKDVTEDLKTKITTDGCKIGDVTLAIKECLGDDLKNFYNDHGHHLNTCLERIGLKDKKRGKKGRNDRDKGNTEFIFMDQRHNNIQKLRGIFRNLIQQSADGDTFKDAEHTMLLELLKFHDRFDVKSKGLKNFSVGPHPEYKNTRCFFVVKEDGEKEDFSFQKCLDAIKKKFNLTE